MVSHWTSVCLSIRLYFPDNLSKHQWIFTKFGKCIDIVEVWFGIANGQISSNSELSARHTPIFYFRDDNLSKRQWIVTKLSMCTDIVKIWFGIANGQILMELSARDTPIFSFPGNNLSKYQGIISNLVHALT